MAESPKRAAERNEYENSIVSFARYIRPTMLWGSLHEECFNWLVDDAPQDNKLLLLPRGHLKSQMIAVVAAWNITRDPTSTAVYLTSADDLATLQVDLIKWILESDRYKKLWPEMILPDLKKRSKWSSGQFNVDHPLRQEAGIRDYTMTVKTYRGSSTGLHCDFLYPDDIVDPKNSKTATTRKEVERQFSFFASIKNPGAKTIAAGTRYHYQDIYGQWMDALQPEFNEDTEVIGEIPVWDVMDREVEDRGNGFGNFLWPAKTDPKTKKLYGFNPQILLAKKAEYEANNERANYYSQYYQKVTDPESERMERDQFQYFTKKALYREDHGVWYYDGYLLRLGAGMDVAFTNTRESGRQPDYTAIAVIGVNELGQTFILDLVQFRTDDFDTYYKAVDDLYRKWGFGRITVESTAGGKFVAKEIKQRVIRQGSVYTVVGKPAPTDRSKIERYAAILEPKYTNMAVFHYEGGYIPDLEDQVVEANPKYDDLRDAVVIAVENTQAPLPARSHNKRSIGEVQTQVASSRFGGRARIRRRA